MTVNEALRDIPKDAIIAIGMKSGYVYVGEAGQFHKFDRMLSKEEKKRISASMDKAQETIKTILENGVAPFDKNEMVIRKGFDARIRMTPALYADRLQHTGHALQNAINYKQKMENYLFDWKDFGRREIKETALTPCYEYTQLIVEGLEEGRFWTKEEFDETYNKKEEVQKNAS